LVLDEPYSEIVLGAFTIGLYSLLYNTILQTVSKFVVTSILGSSTVKILWVKVTCKAILKFVTTTSNPS
jgi:hypothetical protein